MLRYSNPLTQPDIERYVRALAAKADLSVVWHDNDNRVFTDGKKLFLPEIKYPLNEDNIRRTLAHAEHEVSHVIHSDFQILKDNGIKGPDSSPLAGIYNLVEDHRIEWLPADEYKGTAEVLDWFMDTNIKSINTAVENALTKNGGKLDEVANDVLSMLHWDTDLRAEWQASSVGQDMRSKMTDPDKIAKLDKLMANKSIADRLRKVREIPGKEGARQAWELAKDIYEILHDDTAEEEIERMKKKAAAEGEGEGEEGDGTPTSKEGKGKGGKPGAGLEYEYTPHDKTPKMERGHWESESHTRVRHGHSTYVPARSDENKIVDHSKPGARIQPNAGFVASMKSSGSPQANVFANRVRTLLQVKSQKHYTHGHKSGKLHGASLHRIEAELPGYSERVFRQKHQTLTLDTAVAVAVDMSGSMSGQKIIHAGIAASLLSHSLGNLLRIPLLIYGFSGDDTPELHVFRNFHEKLVPEDRFNDRFSYGVSELMCQNLDGESVLWGYKHLLPTRNKRKVLIVLSDGQPAASRSGDSGMYLKTVCQSIEADPRVDLYGLGLMDESVKMYYKHHSTVMSTGQLETKLLDLIQRKIV